ARSRLPSCIRRFANRSATRLGDVPPPATCEHRGMTSLSLVSFSDALADAVAAAAPSVVQVQGGRRPASGVVYAEDVVVTMVRTLNGEDGLHVRTGDGTTLDAELAGWDPTTSRAVLRVNGRDGTPIAPAAAGARLGHLVLAVGRCWSNAVSASGGIVARSEEHTSELQ